MIWLKHFFIFLNHTGLTENMAASYLYATLEKRYQDLLGITVCKWLSVRIDSIAMRYLVSVARENLAVRCHGNQHSCLMYWRVRYWRRFSLKSGDFTDYGQIGNLSRGSGDQGKEPGNRMTPAKTDWVDSILNALMHLISPIISPPPPLH